MLVHGDCHTGNVLHHDGGLAFVDWQSAGFGRASSDLAFVSVRAIPSGVRVPAALLDEHVRRSQELGVATDPAFRRTVALEELAILVFQWPSYARWNSDTGIRRVRRRAGRLVRLLSR